MSEDEIDTEEEKPVELSFAGEVYDTLSHIDCSEHVKKKGEFTYLPWTWAWGILMERYPDSTYKFLPPEWGENGTCTVICKVTVKNGKGDKISRTMWLPVLNFANKAISSPDAFALNSAKMRCLVKAIAMHGLAHHIYANESLPREEDAADIHRWKKGEKDNIIKQVMELIDRDDGMEIKKIFDSYEDQAIKNKAFHLFDSPTRSLMTKMIKETPEYQEDVAKALADQKTPTNL